MIYVLSDIHGNERRFASILQQIRLQPQDTLYVLGDLTPPTTYMVGFHSRRGRGDGCTLH